MSSINVGDVYIIQDHGNCFNSSLDGYVENSLIRINRSHNLGNNSWRSFKYHFFVTHKQWDDNLNSYAVDREFDYVINSSIVAQWINHIDTSPEMYRKLKRIRI